MSVLAVIPARLGATRLPRKPLRLLGGVPLVVRVYERVRALDVADRCIVATDDSEVLAACAQYNVPAALTHASHPSGTDRVAQAARELRGPEPDVILNVQGDEPFVARDALLGAVEVVRSGLADIGTAAVRADIDVLQRPDVVKVVCADDGRALYFSRAPIPFLRDAGDATLHATLVRQHVGVYAYSPRALATWVSLPPHPLELSERLEQLRPLAHGLSIGVATATSSERGIDTEMDLVHANERWSALTPQTAILPLA
jgi:3-deoxy-manno-octulosonate cytidylyltransferase (CMP-KDO synthetase)